MQATSTPVVTIGVFMTRDAAEKALADLRVAGYRDDQLGMVFKETSGTTVRMDGTGVSPSEGVAAGAAAGAIAGAAGGALVGAGILAGAIPVVGPVLAVGTLGTVLLNAAGGAAIAGIAGALAGWGLSEEEAEYYENEVKAGRYLVTVESDNGRDARAAAVIVRHGGYDRRTVKA